MQAGDRVELAERFLSTLGSVGVEEIAQLRGTVIEVREVRGSKKKQVVVKWDDESIFSSLSCNLGRVRKDDSREQPRNG